MIPLAATRTALHSSRALHSARPRLLLGLGEPTPPSLQTSASDMLSLGAKRAALYGYTRPAFGVAALGLGYCSDSLQPAQPETRGAVAAARERGGLADALSLLPLAAAGLVGAASAWRGRSGYGWLAHHYERACWATAFAGLTAAAGVEAVVAVTQGPRGDDEEQQRPPLLLGVSAACVLSATAGERLGSGLGRVLAPALVGLSLLSSAAALAGGDARGEQALRTVAYVLVPALHVCMPVYTLSVDGALACSCWSLAAYAVAASEAELPEETGLSSAAVQHLLLAVGTLSLHRVMLRRAPICQY